MNLQNFLKEKNINKDFLEISLKLPEIAEKVSEEILKKDEKVSEKTNIHWENQLNLDISTDKIFLENLKDCENIKTFISEEQDEIVKNNENWKFCFAYDPIDGSSLVDVNLSIWSIFALYSNPNPTKVSQILFAWAFVFWPKITMLISFWNWVFEFFLKDWEFILSKENIKISENSKIFSPWNLRAIKENPNYWKLLNYWIEEEKTLRYSWGMVPDLNWIFCKWQGIFSYPSHSKYPNWKLRLVYEVWPFSFLAENAWWTSKNEKWKRILDLEISEIHERSTIFIWSKNEVEKSLEILNG